jgi:hypothetical protein
MVNNDVLEKEKEFYFGKLRDIEMYCQCHESEETPNPHIVDVQKILFASDEEVVKIQTDGTVVVTAGAEDMIPPPQPMELEDSQNENVMAVGV